MAPNTDFRRTPVLTALVLVFVIGSGARSAMAQETRPDESIQEPPPSVPAQPTEPATPEEVKPQEDSRAAAPPARLFIETVDVRGTKRESVKQIVKGQLRIVPGREYSEAEIREAVYRVKRLPFVLDARPLLERGSDRGRYVLVIEIEETTVASGTARVDRFWDDQWTANTEVGVRRFIGAATMLYASLDGQAGESFGGNADETLRDAAQGGSIGVRAYDSLGPASELYAEIGLRRSSFSGAFSSSSYSWSASAGFVLSLGRNRSIRAQVSGARSKSWDSDESDTAVRVAAALSLIDDRTDDPFAPVRGMRIAVGPSWSESHFSELRSFRSLKLHGSASAHRPLTGPWVLSATAGGLWDRGWIGHRDSFGQWSIGGSLDIGLVKVGHRNGYRAFVSAGVNGTRDKEAYGRSAHVQAGIRGRFGIVSLRFVWDL